MKGKLEQRTEKEKKLEFAQASSAPQRLHFSQLSDAFFVLIMVVIENLVKICQVSKWDMGGSVNKDFQESKEVCDFWMRRSFTPNGQKKQKNKTKQN